MTGPQDAHWLAHADGLAPMSARFDWWPVSLRVSASDAHLLRWVHAHLACTLTCDQPAAAPEVRVTALADAVLLRSVRGELGGTRGRLVTGFAGERWHLDSVRGLAVWHREPQGGPEQVIVRLAENRWLIIASAIESTALAAVRLCRELLRTKLGELRALTVHAALAYCGELGTLLIVGRAGAGKTTLALGVAHGSGFVVSSDQTALLGRWDGTVLGVGLPNANRVGTGTIGRLTAVSGTPVIPLLRDGSRAYAGDPAPDKLWVTPLETEVLYRVASAPCARVDGIVLLGATTGLATPRAAPATPDRLLRDLTAEFRGADPLFPKFWLAAPESAPPPGGNAEDTVALLGGIPAAQVQWDPARHEIARVLACLAPALAGQDGSCS